MTDADSPNVSTQRLNASAVRSDEDAGVALVVYGRDGSEVVFFDGDHAIVVGRAAPADLILREPSLSRRHASFRRAPDGNAVVVEDLQSLNGTSMLGVALDGPRTLRPGDEVHLGEVVVRVERLPKSARGQGLLGHDAFVRRVVELLARGAALTLVLVRRPDASPAAGFSSSLLESLPRAFGGLYATHTVEVCASHEDGVDDGALAAAAVAAGLVVGEARAPRDGRTLDALLDHAVLALSSSRASRSSPSPSSSLLSQAGLLERVAPSSLPVLILGETGAGKDVMARALHEKSKRKGAFVAVNCGALPAGLLENTLFGHEKGAFTGAQTLHKGVFEAADGGTVFLDEIGELPPAAQVALLRVLEVRAVQRVGGTKEIPVDVRVLGATHRDLAKLVESGAFRQDLYFRLNALEVKVPPLRERKSEIPALAEALRARASTTVVAPSQKAPSGFTPAALSALSSHAWPGNVRELKNAIERALVIAHGPLIDVDDLPEAVRSSAPVARAVDAEEEAADEESDDDAAIDVDEAAAAGPFKDRLRRFESKLIVDALEKTGGVQTQAAKVLGMPLRTLVHKMKVYGIPARPRSE